MKRALAIAVALCALGFAGFAQLSGSTTMVFYLTGSMQTPSFGIYSDLFLRYVLVDKWAITNYSIFDNTGFSYTQFGVSGEMGPFTIAGTMRFFPLATQKLGRTDVRLTFTFGGVDIGWWVIHQIAGSTGTVSFPIHRFPLRNVYCGDQWAISVSPGADKPAMVYYHYLRVGGTRVDLFLIDECSGIQFYQLFAELTFPFCCGADVETEFSFTKAGFQHVKFILKNFELCCNLKWNVEVLFDMTAGKTVKVKPVFGKYAACFDLYGGWDWVQNQFSGFSLHGFGCKLSLGDCTEIGVLTAFAPQYFWVNAWAIWSNWDAMGSTYFYRYYDTAQPLPTWWYVYHTSLFKGAEYEMIWIKTCGAGCCGGTWSFEVDVFFVPTGGLFDLNRFRVYASFPIMSNLSLGVLANMPLTGLDLLAVGLTLSF